ncbi:MAG: hypothetical protein H7838_00545 [Magnetococcus sp. DMHC-8]
MSENIFTLLLSRSELPAGWQETLLQRLPGPSRLHLFCLAGATRLVGDNFSRLPPGRRAYCAHSHHLLGAPQLPAGSPFVAGGLITLGGMVRDSHGIVTLPHACWPVEQGVPGVKEMGILLGNEREMQKEAIRLATGLAGCHHAVTLYSPLAPAELRLLLPETASLLEALLALGAEFKIISSDDPPGNHPVLLQL